MDSFFISARGKHVSRAVDASSKCGIPAGIVSSVLSVALCAMLALSAAQTPAYAVTSTEKQAEADAISANIDALQTKINAAQSEYNRALEASVAAEAAAKGAASRAEVANARMVEIQEQLGTRTVGMYKSGGNMSFLNVLLGSSSFESFLTNWDAMEAIANNDAKLVQESREVREEARAAEAQYKEEQQRAVDEMNSAQAAQADLAASKASMESELAKVNEEVATLAYQEEQERISQEQANSRYNAANSVIIPSDIVGGWVHPCPGYQYISTEFGYSSWHGYWHNGTDLAAAMGTPILAACAGTVTYIGWYGGGGNTVIVSHGSGVQTIYMHQSQTAASLGQQVSAGEVIGYVGSTGDSSGPHLHFQVEVDGVPVNCRNFINP